MQLDGSQASKQASLKKACTAAQLYINGEYTDGSSGETFEVVDPRTEEVMANCALANADDVDRAAKAAREAFDHGEWTQMGGAVSPNFPVWLACCFPWPAWLLPDSMMRPHAALVIYVV